MPSAIFLHPWRFTSLEDLTALMDCHDEEKENEGKDGSILFFKPSHHLEGHFALNDLQKNRLAKKFGWANPGVIASFKVNKLQRANASVLFFPSVLMAPFKYILFITTQSSHRQKCFLLK